MAQEKQQQQSPKSDDVDAAIRDWTEEEKKHMEVVLALLKEKKAPVCSTHGTTCVYIGNHTWKCENPAHDNDNDGLIAVSPPMEKVQLAELLKYKVKQ